MDELLELVSLDPAETRDRYPGQLSGGQRQRVGVARALAVDPPLMLMDEPFGAIDPINRERLQNEFLRLQKEIRKTIVFVTHDIDEAIKMGDRIAVLQKGGKLAQYAPPAELLMYPNGRFVEDFVGADRALKRLALQRVRDIDLWRAPLVRVGEPAAEARAKVADSDLPYPLLVDDEGRPLGWLSERALTGERVTDDLRSSAEPIVELDDVLRDALSDLLQHETQYGPVVDARGAVAGVLSLEIIGHALKADPEKVPSGADALVRRTTDARAARPGAAPGPLEGRGPAAWPTTASARAGSPTTSTATRTRSSQHVYLTLVSLAIGFAISFGLALLAHRRRWLVGPITQITGGPLHAAQPGRVLPAPADHRAAATRRRSSRWSRYSLLIIFRNIMTGLDNVPAETKDAGRGMGLTDRQLLWRVELPLALPEILAGLRIAATTIVGLATLAFFAGAGGLGEQIFADITFKSNVVTAGGLAVLLAAVLDGLILLVQRAVTPWTRARAA